MAASNSKKASDFGRKLPTLNDPNKCTTEREIRQRILLETLCAFEESSATRRYHELAEINLQKWREQAEEESDAQSLGSRDSGGDKGKVIVERADWGVCTARLTQKYGTTFAVLNMANANVPGGGYTEGLSAQEENMFRRSDCHFSIDRNDTASVRVSENGFDGDLEYTVAMTRFLNGKDEAVYLDTDNPRVCIRGPEDRSRKDLGYDFLPDDEVFQFYELRAAAVDMRGKRKSFDEDEMRKRICAQLDTLTKKGVRHVVLSAFGCGAFLNPAAEVSAIYHKEIKRRMKNFDIIAFAIYDPGYGPDNFTPFYEVFVDSSVSHGSYCGTPKRKQVKADPFSTP
mmetsp:Transcript_6035/g.13140  ORF Transcript_6035/g.13140 Transcript_6035/m.13140 type:complete len:342 (+) Transcript_6035:101-1126(+)|eukprot:CAMPEP_0178475738 /NCGR_PEP_ID=MMETSP0696-20121128/3269_1 /TAXON_ID=265572 /ORGANISM="Extubocellulus spinifer, Strain CCMP396" /LENGTH=341 /DNA_ID=CAMNT_0020103025 /DNA_START=12 /DNA_END=1037 /DNA_ORIENTATION=+